MEESCVVQVDSGHQITFLWLELGTSKCKIKKFDEEVKAKYRDARFFL